MGGPKASNIVLKVWFYIIYIFVQIFNIILSIE